MQLISILNFIKFTRPWTIIPIQNFRNPKDKESYKCVGRERERERESIFGKGNNFNFF